MGHFAGMPLAQMSLTFSPTLEGRREWWRAGLPRTKPPRRAAGVLRIL
jgi:hypothetical protein